MTLTAAAGPVGAPDGAAPLTDARPITGPSSWTGTETCNRKPRRRVPRIRLEPTQDLALQSE
jgi:hypothetical protein